MKISTQQKCQLRKKAHHLNPVIILGQQGLTPAVQLEIERALLDHELIKIRINAENRDARKLIIQQICRIHNTILIQDIGHIAVIYRKK